MASETWADAQFDMLEAAYNEVPTEAKARIAELESENAKLLELVKDIDEVADPFLGEFIGRRMRELGIEVDE